MELSHLNCDIFFVSMDEPRADEFFRKVYCANNKVQRIHGVKGWGTMLRACADASSTERFFTIDGDNEVLWDFFGLRFQLTEEMQSTVLSWSARNSVNGLEYGNGGIKNWPRSLASASRTHELSPTASVDFFPTLPYWQVPETLSLTWVNQSPQQAYRAGYREGIKLAMAAGIAPGKKLPDPVPPAARQNLDRLRIWASVGSDVTHGDWAILGARRGLLAYLKTSDYFPALHDHSCLEMQWEKEGSALAEGIQSTGAQLESVFPLSLEHLTPSSSAFFKSLYLNPRRSGPLN
jgi:hypothetical protein